MAVAPVECEYATPVNVVPKSIAITNVEVDGICGVLDNTVLGFVSFNPVVGRTGFDVGGRSEFELFLNSPKHIGKVIRWV